MAVQDTEERVVAKPGDPAMGVEGDYSGVFSSVHTFGRASMSDDGDLAFEGRSDEGRGIWYDNGTEDTLLIMQEGAIAPGLPDTTYFYSGNYPYLPRPYFPLMAGPGKVVFTAQVTGATGGVHLWRANMGETGCSVYTSCLEPVFVRGDMVPGINAPYGLLWFQETRNDGFSVNSHGRIAFSAYYQERIDADTWENRTGIFLSDEHGSISVVPGAANIED
ncbi:unnamed protein product, partial [marine sediment metagenome]